ncbi:hypothetical protein FRX31_008623, partial [Thalictrum thalictroides]
MLSESCGTQSKKHKTIEIEELTDDNTHYTPQLPLPTIDPQSTLLPLNQPPTSLPSPFSLDFIRQILQNPETATILANDEVINPKILTLLAAPPPQPRSPTSIFDGPYAVVFYDENEVDNEGFNEFITIPNSSTEMGVVTIDDSVAGIQGAPHGINESQDSLLYPSSTEVHNE